MTDSSGSGRRGFIRRFVKLGAAAGAAGLLLGRLREPQTSVVDQLLPGQLVQVNATTAVYVDTSTPVLSATNNASGGATVGVYGEADSTLGTGVYGVATAHSGSAYGVRGESASTNGGGIIGFASASGGTASGVYGETPSSAGRGVQGYATANSGSTCGVYGRSDSCAGIGVLGLGQVSGSVGMVGHVGSPGAIPIIALGDVSQSVNLQQWQNGPSLTVGAVNASGSLGVGTGSPQYKLDLNTSGSSSSQLHITSTGTDSGGYFTSANPGNLFMAGGAVWNGSSWVAKSSTSYQYGGGVAGVRFFFDSGLTVGSTYTPTPRLVIDPNGNLGVNITRFGGGSRVIAISNSTAPSTNVSGAGILFVQSGALKYRGASGTVTTLATA